MKTHHEYSLTAGFALIGVYLFIRYQISRRRFNRRGIGGLQQFSSYRKYVTVTTIEQIIMIAGNLCGLAGLFLLAVAGIKHLKF